MNQIQGDGFMRISKICWFTLGVTFLAFSQFGCTATEPGGDGDQKSVQSDSLQTQPDVSNPDSVENNGESLIPRDEAEQIALEEIPGSHLLSCELELDEGRWVYSVQARNSQGVYEVKIDAQTGEVIETDDETAKFQAMVVEGKAIMQPVNLADRDASEQVALNAYPGTVQEWKAVADSSGRLAFSFEIQTETGGTKKVVVSAGTNEILKVK
jgi:uncharacterized membrane protein YkoI